MSYDLIKDFIQFAHSSKVVGGMVTNRASEDDIHNHIVKGKLEQVTGNRDLSEAQPIVNMLDQVSPRYVLRELNGEICRMLSQSKG